MKRIRISISILSVLFCLSTSTAFGDWYTNVFGGVVAGSEGYTLGIAAGKELNPYFKYEGEFSFCNYNSQTVIVHGGPSSYWGYGTYESSNKYNYYNGMLNGVVSVLPNQIVNPYLGIGAGVSYKRSYWDYPMMSVSGTEWRPALQESVGLQVNIFKRSQLGIEYRMVHDIKLEDGYRSLLLNYALNF